MTIRYITIPNAEISGCVFFSLIRIGYVSCLDHWWLGAYVKLRVYLVSNGKQTLAFWKLHKSSLLFTATTSIEQDVMCPSWSHEWIEESKQFIYFFVK